MHRADLVEATRAALAKDLEPCERLRLALRHRFSASHVLLTDSGTSALLIAMQLLAPSGTVALPAYSCVDLAAAAIGAGVRVRLYDVNPRTLGPDADDLRSTLERGVDALVVVHLFGYPVAMREVLEIAGQASVPVIEDAAQAAAGRLGERLLGTFGDMTVLSFGRGKGLSGGGGGALLGRGDVGERMALLAAQLETGGPGWRNLGVATAQWALGRPALYGVPSRIPWLHLGEMVYHPPTTPASLSIASAALVLRSLDRADRDAERRKAMASRIGPLAMMADKLRVVEPVGHARPGYLRFPVLDYRGRRPTPDTGILRSYPGTLADQSVLHGHLADGEVAGAGARELGAWLFTLPTHSMIRDRDVHNIAQWLGGRRRPQTAATTTKGDAPARALPDKTETRVRAEAPRGLT